MAIAANLVSILFNFGAIINYIQNWLTIPSSKPVNHFMLPLTSAILFRFIGLC